VVAQRADAAGRRKRAVVVWTAVTIVTMAALWFVEDDAAFLPLGLVLLGLGSIFFELASVSYNAVLTQVSTPETVGRISGFGWAMGYLGGIVLLLIAYVGFIAGDGGLLGLPTEGGVNIRAVALLAAAWFLLFAIPLVVAVPEVPPVAGRGRAPGLVESYRILFRDLRALYRESPHTVYFLGASALFRDGLAAVFTFGAVLAVTVYGIAEDDVLLFGIAANVVAAAGAFAGGFLDDRIGPKLVIVGSLAAMIASGWRCSGCPGRWPSGCSGWRLATFVGPAQSSSAPSWPASPRPGARASCSGSTPPPDARCRSSRPRWSGCSRSCSPRTARGSSASSWCSPPVSWRCSPCGRPGNGQEATS
jgi:UMF1 family MFS transporter